MIRNHALIRDVVPIFPRYVFVKIVDDVIWHSVLSLKGILDFIRVGSIPAFIPEREMRALVARVGVDGIIHEEQVVADRFHSGDNVMIGNASHIAFKQNGVYRQRIDRNLVLIDMPWLGRMIPMQVEEDDLVLMPTEKREKRKRLGKRERLAAA